MQQRYYWPGGRFLSVDPVTADTVGGNFNRYWYANNNPYRFTDPDGRQSVGEMIDDKAMTAAGRSDGLATYGWAFAATAWNYLGFEGVSQVADKGTNAGYGNDGLAVLEVATLGKGKLVATPIRSLIKADSFLVKAAQTAGKSAQKSLDALTNQLAKGNLNPGIGTKSLFAGIFEARARDGARVYFRNGEEGIEILAKSNKANQDVVIGG